MNEMSRRGPNRPLLAAFALLISAVLLYGLGIPVAPVVLVVVAWVISIRNRRPRMYFSRDELGVKPDPWKEGAKFGKSKRKRLCGKCGYDLRGTEHERCPECGIPLKEGRAAT